MPISLSGLAPIVAEITEHMQEPWLTMMTTNGAGSSS
jgi:hypothetical protein